jgi:hypothetical protein
MKEINQDWYAQNKDRAAVLAKAWAAKNPEKMKIAGRKGHLKKTYGLTLDEYDALLESQDGRCGGCGEDFDDATPHVDHDHVTGVVRGLLCSPCNKALGMALESPERLQGLVRYLRRSRKRLVR